MNQDWSHFARDLLKQSRARAGLSQHKLAVLAGVSNAEVARIETYRVQPSIPVLGKLLDAIGLGVQLLGEYIDNRVSAREAAESIKKEIAASNDQRAFLNWLILLDDLNAVTAVRLLDLVCDPAPPTGSSHYDALMPVSLNMSASRETRARPIGSANHGDLRKNGMSREFQSSTSLSAKKAR